MTSLRGLADSARAYLPQQPFARWASVFFSLSTLTLFISLSAAEAFLALSAVCFFISMGREIPAAQKTGKIIFPPIKLPLALFCLWTFVAMYFAENRAAGGFVIRKLVLFVILLVAVNVIRSLRHLEFLFLGLFVQAGLAAALGVVQFIVQYHHVRALYPQQVYFYMTLTRITGFMGHWMNFSGQQMMAFTSLAALLLVASAADQGLEPGKAIQRWRNLEWILAAVVALSIFLSFTRGVWLGCLAGVVYLLGRRFPRWLWVLPVLLVAGYFLSPRLVRERVNLALHPSRDPALSIRFEMWSAGLKMIERHPWVGVGPNNIFEVYPLYLPAGRTPEIGYHEHLHNNFIQFAAERGLPCLAAWVWLMGALGWHTLGIRRRLRALPQARWVADAAFASWLAFLTEGFFEFNFGTSPVLLVFLFLASTPFVVESLVQAEGTPQLKTA